MDHAATGGHTDLSDRAATSGHGDVQVCAAAEGHVWISGLTEVQSVFILVARVSSKGHTDVCDLHCSLKPCWGPWFLLHWRALSGSMALLHLGTLLVFCADTRNHAEAHDPHSLRPQRANKLVWR